MELASVRVGTEKITTDKNNSLIIYAHKRPKREVCNKLRILTNQVFGQITWLLVSEALHEVSRLFQPRVCKQVTDVVGTNHN